MEIGRRLRAARESQGLTVQDVATRTRIHSAYLEKIEAGVTEGLPALTFVRGFMRNYIQTLAIDDHSLVEAVQELGAVPPAAPPPQPLRAATTEKLLGMETERTNWTKWLLIGALVILVFWVGYLIVRVSTSDSTPASTTETTPAPAPGATPAPAPATPAPAPTPTPAPAANPRPGASTEPRANLRLTVRGLEDTWVRLSLDRQNAVDVLVRPAESLTFDANDEIKLTVGKSQGVSVYLNGLEVALPAEKNRLVADLTLNKLSLIKMQN
ncbi:MAG TPA: RodZ domain-containing protein [bacterium]